MYHLLPRMLLTLHDIASSTLLLAPKNRSPIDTQLPQELRKTAGAVGDHEATSDSSKVGIRWQ